jgi:2-iminobutanoate/2-iminopropanoate deaminase
MDDSERRAVVSATAPRAIGPYSRAIVARGWVFCSGQIALDPRSGELVGASDVKVQTRQVMENLKAVLEGAGSSFARVVKTTIYLADMGDFGAVNEVYGSYFAGEAPPARATVQVAGLPKGAMVEIDAVALA